MALTTEQKLRMLELGLGIAGSAMTAKSQADAADRQADLYERGQRMSASQFRAQLLQRMQEREEDARLARSTTALSASPLGQNENFATRNRIARALIPQLAQGTNLRPNDPNIARLIPDGLDLSGVITPDMLEAIGEDATAAAIANRSKLVANVDPDAPTPDFEAMGFDPENTALVEKYAQNRSQYEHDQKVKVQDLIARALEEDLMGEQSRGPAPEGYEYDEETGELKKKGSGFWGKLGKGLLIGGAGLATVATGGAASPALAAAVGAGTGAALGAMDGGGWKGALLGAGTGALTGGVGGGVAGAGGRAAIINALKDPRFYARVVGRTIGGPVGTGLTLGSEFFGNGRGVGTPPFSPDEDFRSYLRRRSSRPRGAA